MIFAQLSALIANLPIFASKISLGNGFDKLAEVIRKVLDCERATIYLLDNAKRELLSRAATGTLLQIRLKLGEGIAGTVALTGKPIVLESAHSDPNFCAKIDSKTHFTTKSMITWPLIDLSTGNTIGVYQALNKNCKCEYFTQNDLILAEVLADILSNQIKMSFEYADFTSYEYKLKRVLNVSI